MIRTKKIIRFGLLLIASLVITGCVSTTDQTQDMHKYEKAADLLRQAHEAEQTVAEVKTVDQLPVRYQQPAYTVKPVSSVGTFGDTSTMAVPVGADISTQTGPVPLRDIIKRIVALKNMNISWANDVDQGALVDVDIRAEDDFFGSIDHLLRQLDYFHEIEGNTIVVKHKDVRKFHIAMPFVASTYSHGLGGDVLGGGDTAGNMKGKIELTTGANEFDIWKNIQENLDKVLEVWTEATPQTETPSPQTDEGAKAEAAPPVASRPPTGKGYYTIDKPIGLITVTAPHSLLEKISTYIENLKSELYKQVAIEAKIVEVTLDNDNTTGINWDSLLQNTSSVLNFNVDWQKLNPAYAAGGSGRFLTMADTSFGLILDALHQQGSTDVIANPRVSVMNGQPALISIGSNVTYIDSVTSTVDEGVVTYSVNTSSVMSGLGLAVVATIMDNNEIILTLTPVTSKLKQPIEYKTFGGDNTVGLPEVDVREMNTIVRVKNNEMLVVGGLIDNAETSKDSKIPGLGDVPGIKKLFSSGGTVTKRKELVIFLKPRIMS